MKKLFAKTQYELTGKIIIEKTHWTEDAPTFRLEIKDDGYTREMKKESLIVLRDELSDLIELHE